MGSIPHVDDPLEGGVHWGGWLESRGGGEA
jgi:hypothetical protein